MARVHTLKLHHFLCAKAAAMGAHPPSARFGPGACERHALSGLPLPVGGAAVHVHEDGRDRHGVAAILRFRHRLVDNMPYPTRQRLNARTWHRVEVFAKSDLAPNRNLPPRTISLGAPQLPRSRPECGKSHVGLRSTTAETYSTQPPRMWPMDRTIGALASNL